MKIEDKFKHREGKILIPNKFIQEPDPLMMCALFSVFYPTHIERATMHNFDSYWYYGYSDKFEVLEQGVIVPHYEVIFERIGSSIVVKEFKQFK